MIQRTKHGPNGASPLISVFGRHVASATRVPSKRPRTSERSRIRQAGVLRPWQSEESVGPFFSSSPAAVGLALLGRCNHVHA